MWSGCEINASPLRTDKVEALRKRDLNALKPAELDWLVAKSMTTIGGVPTFKFFLWRFLVAMLGGFVGPASDAQVVLPRLEEAAFDQWPAEQQTAILEGLRLWAEQRIARDDADDDADWTYDSPDAEALEIMDWVNARAQSR